MKILNQINDITTKVAKGMVALFAIKLILILGVFTFNACSSNDSEVSDKNNEEFQNAMDLSISNLDAVGVFNTNGAMKNLNNGSKTLHLISETNQIFNDTSFLNSINDLNSLVNVQYQNNLSLTENLNTSSNVLSTFIIDEQPVIDALLPTAQEARNYLINTKGFTNQEINDMLIMENGTELDLIPLVYTMTTIESNNATISFNYMSLFGETAYAQTWSEVGQCALAAIGADLIWSLGSDGGKWTKKAIKKAFGAVAKRFLGPIGVAIAVVTFAICLANNSLQA